MSKIIKGGKKSLGQTLSAFRQNQLGSIAPIVALSLLPLLLAVGAGVDSYRISQERIALGGATDAACVAVASDDRSSTSFLTQDQLAKNKAEIQLLAANYLNSNMRSPLGTPEIASLEYTSRTITINTRSIVPTTFMKLAGVNTSTVSASCEVTKNGKGVEVALVMDTTGSMNIMKLNGSKDAARTMLNALYGGDVTTRPSNRNIRVGLVPFAGAVRLDPNSFGYSETWIDTTGKNPYSRLNFNKNFHNYQAWETMKSVSHGSVSWRGCVEARSNTLGYNIDDTAPSQINGQTLFPPYLAPDTTYQLNLGNLLSTNYFYNKFTISNGTVTEFETPPSGGGPEFAGLTAPQIKDMSVPGLWYKTKNHFKYNWSLSQNTLANSPDSGCAESAIAPLTYNRQHIEDSITKMQAGGNTVIPEGLAWGWRVLSPTAPFTHVEGTTSIPSAPISPYPASQNGQQTQWRKVMVLMTDGDNMVGAAGASYADMPYYTGSFYSAYGFANEPQATNRFGVSTNNRALQTQKLDEAMASLCTRIKATGIEIFVTSFGSDVTNATKRKLELCATKPAYYKHSATSAELNEFFDSVAESLNDSLYMSK